MVLYKFSQFILDEEEEAAVDECFVLGEDLNDCVSQWAEHSAIHSDKDIVYPHVDRISLIADGDIICNTYKNFTIRDSLYTVEYDDDEEGLRCISIVADSMIVALKLWLDKFPNFYPSLIKLENLPLI